MTRRAPPSIALRSPFDRLRSVCDRPCDRPCDRYSIGLRSASFDPPITLRARARGQRARRSPLRSATRTALRRSNRLASDRRREGRKALVMPPAMSTLTTAPFRLEGRAVTRWCSPMRSIASRRPSMPPRRRLTSGLAIGSCAASPRCARCAAQAPIAPALVPRLVQGASVRARSLTRSGVCDVRGTGFAVRPPSPRSGHAWSLACSGCCRWGFGQSSSTRQRPAGSIPSKSRRRPFARAFLRWLGNKQAALELLLGERAHGRSTARPSARARDFAPWSTSRPRKRPGRVGGVPTGSALGCDRSSPHPPAPLLKNFRSPLKHEAS